MIDMEKDVPIPKESELETIAELASILAHNVEQAATMENELACKKEDIRFIMEEALPKAMSSVGLSSFVLKDGTKLKIETFYRGSIPKAREGEAFQWLYENGHEDLIKNEVKCAFGKGEDEKAEQLMRTLTDSHFNYESKKAVHPSTLKAFVREQLENGKSLPLDLLGVYVGQRSKIGR